MIPIVLLGEKDHGKSTLIGRLIFETGSMPDDRLQDIRSALASAKKKFEWAHLLDSFRYEREREMTVDTTRAVIRHRGELYECIDVPGHKSLIKNMLTGASEARFAIVVIDIRAGIKAQTVRHLKIAKFLGIEKIIIAVNKCDLAQYSEAAFAKLGKKLSIRLGALGYADARMIPLVAFEGDNLLTRSKKMAWYEGPTLCEAIKTSFVAPPASKHAGTAVAIQNVFGKIIIGKIYAGSIKTRDRLTVWPGRKQIAVRDIWIGKTRVKTASANAPVSISVSSSEGLQRGNVLSKGYPVSHTNKIKAACLFIKRPSKTVSIDANFNTSEAALVGTVRQYDPMDIRLTLQKKIPLLDKFVIRQKSEIIGIGRLSREHAKDTRISK